MMFTCFIIIYECVKYLWYCSYRCMLNNSTFLGCAATYHYLDFWSVKIVLLATCCGYMQLLSMIITLLYSFPFKLKYFVLIIFIYNMWPSLRKPSLSAHLVFREIATILKHWSHFSSLVPCFSHARFTV